MPVLELKWDWVHLHCLCPLKTHLLTSCHHLGSASWPVRCNHHRSCIHLLHGSLWTAPSSHTLIVVCVQFIVCCMCMLLECCKGGASAVVFINLFFTGETEISSRHDLRASKTASLPPGSAPPTASGFDSRRQTSTIDHRRRLSESSSESDSPVSQKSKDKKSSGLMNFLRRKKATNL